MKSQIVEYIVAYLPMIFCGLAYIISAFKLIDSFKGSNLGALLKEMKNLANENIKLQHSMQKVLAENEELKVQIKEVIYQLEEEANKVTEDVGCNEEVQS